MKRIRIKKEIALVWAVTTNGHEEPLAGRNLSLFLVDPKYRKTAKTFHIENGNEVHFRVYPSEQPFTGVYTLELWENLGGQDQTVVDKRSAFELVNFTPQECDGSVDDIHAAEVFIGAGNLAVGIHGRGIVSVTKVSEDPNDWDYRILYDDGATEIIQIARGEKGLTDEEHAELIAETLAAKSAAQSANLAATLAASKAAEAAEAAQTATNAAEAANAAKEAADAATEAAQEATAAANAAKTAANNAATLANNAAANANTKAALAQAAADATNAAIAAASTATAAANAATAAANTAAEAANTAAATANSAASNASAKATLANDAAVAANAAKDAANAAAALANDAAARAEAAILTIENKIERVELVCEDDQHITRKGSSVALTYDEVKALVDEPKNFVTLRYLDMFWMLPSYDDGGAIMFTSSGIEFGHVVVTRVILNTDGQMNNYSIIAEDADHKTDDMSKETAMDGHMTYPTTHAVNLKLDDLQSEITELDNIINGNVKTTEAIVQGNGYIQKYLGRSGNAETIVFKLTASNASMNGMTVKLYYKTTSLVVLRDITIGNEWQEVVIPAAYTDIYLFGTEFTSFVNEKVFFTIKENGGLSVEVEELKNGINGVSITIKDITVTDRIAKYLGLSGHANDILYFSFIAEGTSVEKSDIRIMGTFSSGLKDIITIKGDSKYAKVVIPQDYTNIYLFSVDTKLVRGDKFDVKVTTTIGLADKVEMASNNKPYKGKTFAIFGDSITEFHDSRTGKTWSEHFAEITGANVINLGIGGTRITPRSEYSPTMGESQAYCRLDIKNAINAVIGKNGSQDFTRFEEGVVWLRNNTSDDNTAILERARATDLALVDYVVIFGGTNDWYANTGSQATSTLTDIVRTIYTEYPHLNIFIFTPIPRFCENVRDDEHWSDNVKKDGLTLKELAENICGLQHTVKVPTYNSYDLVGINQWNFSNYFQSTDGTHPYLGMEHLARRFSAFVSSVEKI